ncbi:unnamed protein product [Rotaria sordida]|uniref:Elongator complex protein 2 n=1 Tax=Rotaria sordida TaxID=392033 RepID=A0A813S9E4_9BILA|nr:unnamed protein product [Rotaria sordida]
MANVSTDIKIDVDYISAACNCCPHSLDWQNGPRLIYGVTNSVALCSDTAPFSVRKTFSGHQGRLNCVKWVRQEQRNSNSDFYYFLSASVDKTISLWKGKDEDYTKYTSLVGHQNSVTTVVGYQQSPNDDIYVASGSADSTIKIWCITDTLATCLHTLDFKNGFAITLELVPLDNHKNIFLLFVATDKNKVQIYQVSNSVIEQIFVLSGHEDWIRSITVQKLTSFQWFVATCSQDNYIRIWQLSFNESNNQTNVDPTILKLKRSSFALKITDESPINVNVELYSILLGHEEAIYGLCWYPNTDLKKAATTILSASMDKSMVLWTFDDNQKMYIDKARVGEVGGNTLGFYGCTFSPCGSYILGHGYEGALHLWKIEEIDDRINLIPQVINSGHFNTVEDCCWDRHSGRYLLSVSTDQTARLHAEWKRNGIISWHEIGRPQIHGYEMKCLTFIGSNQQRFVSGADEKILRVFDPPKNFLENFARITKINVDEDIQKAQSLPEGANVPALGLSNKAIFDNDENQTTTTSAVIDDDPMTVDGLYKEGFFKAIVLNEPPFEEHLLQNTLWPEIQKLYGHGYEIIAVASNPSGSIIASTCKTILNVDRVVYLNPNIIFINSFDKLWSLFDQFKSKQAIGIFGQCQISGTSNVLLIHSTQMKNFKIDFNGVNYLSTENIYFLPCKYILDVDHCQSKEEILFLPETINHSLFGSLYKIISRFDLTKSNHWNDFIENEFNQIENTQCRNKLIELFLTNKKS